MTRTLRSLFLAGLGTLDFTEEKLRSIFEELVHRGELHEKDANDLVAAWKKRAQERRESFEARVREIVQEELTRKKLADRDEVERLTEHVMRLEQRAPIEEVPAR